MEIRDQPNTRLHGESQVDREADGQVDRDVFLVCPLKLRPPSVLLLLSFPTQTRYTMLPPSDYSVFGPNNTCMELPRQKQIAMPVAIHQSSSNTWLCANLARQRKGNAIERESSLSLSLSVIRSKHAILGSNVHKTPMIRQPHYRTP